MSQFYLIKYNNPVFPVFGKLLLLVETEKIKNCVAFYRSLANIKYFSRLLEKVSNIMFRSLKYYLKLKSLKNDQKSCFSCYVLPLFNKIIPAKQHCKSAKHMSRHCRIRLYVLFLQLCPLNVVFKSKFV